MDKCPKCQRLYLYDDAPEPKEKLCFSRFMADALCVALERDLLSAQLRAAQAEVARLKAELKDWQDWGFSLATAPICSDEELREKLGAVITQRCCAPDPSGKHHCTRLLGHGSPRHWDGAHSWPAAEAEVARLTAENEALRREVEDVRALDAFEENGTLLPWRITYGPVSKCWYFGPHDYKSAAAGRRAAVEFLKKESK